MASKFSVVMEIMMKHLGVTFCWDTLYIGRRCEIVNMDKNNQS